MRFSLIMLILSLFSVSLAMQVSRQGLEEEQSREEDVPSTSRIRNDLSCCRCSEISEIGVLTQRQRENVPLEEITRIVDECRLEEELPECPVCPSRDELNQQLERQETQIDDLSPEENADEPPGEEPEDDAIDIEQPQIQILPRPTPMIYIVASTCDENEDLKILQGLVPRRAFETFMLERRAMLERRQLTTAACCVSCLFTTLIVVIPAAMIIKAYTFP